MSAAVPIAMTEKSARSRLSTGGSVASHPLVRPLLKRGVLQREHHDQDGSDCKHAR